MATLACCQGFVRDFDYLHHQIMRFSLKRCLISEKALMESAKSKLSLQGTFLRRSETPSLFGQTEALQIKTTWRADLGAIV
jgi:hypothetical protein